MLSAGAWKLSQQNLITFVLVDTNGNEVTGLGNGFTLELSKAGAAFAGSAGTKAEISNGWYKYTSTAGEADTVGPVAIKVTHASIVQQNLEYTCESRAISSIEFTYTLTNSVTAAPIEGAQIWITVDAAGNNVIWAGATDSLGIARDDSGGLPRLDPGTYFFFRQKAGFTFSPEPDTEIVS
jgi:hypothetical protein